jgi:anaerobic magnesium-protoporphyrin IX monomethyl ester cyclase
MKVLIAYPPLPSAKGVPLLSQNRQFQWFNAPTFVYPMVPASAATRAAQAGHDVRWADGIAERWSPQRFEDEVRRFAPDFILIEAKTPVIKTYWRVIRRLKEIHPAGRIALCGDHVTALPEESLNACPVDFILTGGDYDFTLTELLAHLQPGAAPHGGATPLPGDGASPTGVFYRGDGGIRSTGAFTLTRDLDTLPFIDRELTRWTLYAYANGNYKYTPGTYTMVGRDCWWGRCAFCSWTTLYTNWRTQTPERLLDEIGDILDRYPVREIFDDTGCFPAGRWLRTFCEGVMARGYHKRVVLGCNMIPGVLSQDLYALMAAANFRFVLFGLESADQGTLDRIHKCGKSRDIADSMRMAKRAGLEPHVTCMVGYPWETRAQARATIALTRSLFDKGDIDTLQATIVIPYPGTPLFAACRRNGWLKTEDWDRYDMREPVMNTPMPDAEVMALTRGIYRSFLTPRFLWRKLRSIRSWRDVIFYARAAVRVAGHLLDFRGPR